MNLHSMMNITVSEAVASSAYTDLRGKENLISKELDLLVYWDLRGGLSERGIQELSLSKELEGELRP